MNIKESSKSNFWVIGQNYFIRTVTYFLIGRLKEIIDNELVFESSCWIPDTGRFHQFIKDGKLNEVEPFISDVLINRSSIIDSTYWTHELPRSQL